MVDGGHNDICRCGAVRFVRDGKGEWHACVLCSWAVLDQAEATREGANSEAGAARISSPAPFFDTRRVHLADG